MGEWKNVDLIELPRLVGQHYLDDNLKIGVDPVKVIYFIMPLAKEAEDNIELIKEDVEMDEVLGAIGEKGFPRGIKLWVEEENEDGLLGDDEEIVNLVDNDSDAFITDKIAQKTKDARNRKSKRSQRSGDAPAKLASRSPSGGNGKPAAADAADEDGGALESNEEDEPFSGLFEIEIESEIAQDLSHLQEEKEMLQRQLDDMAGQLELAHQDDGSDMEFLAKELDRLRSVNRDLEEQLAKRPKAEPGKDLERLREMNKELHKKLAAAKDGGGDDGDDGEAGIYEGFVRNLFIQYGGDSDKLEADADELIDQVIGLIEDKVSAGNASGGEGGGMSAGGPVEVIIPEKEAASLAQVSKKELKRMLEKGEIEALEDGGFRQSDLLKVALSLYEEGTVPRRKYDIDVEEAREELPEGHGDGECVPAGEGGGDPAQAVFFSEEHYDGEMLDRVLNMLDSLNIKPDGFDPTDLKPDEDGHYSIPAALVNLTEQIEQIEALEGRLGELEEEFTSKQKKTEELERQITSYQEEESQLNTRLEEEKQELEELDNVLGDLEQSDLKRLRGVIRKLMDTDE